MLFYLSWTGFVCCALQHQKLLFAESLSRSECGGAALLWHKNGLWLIKGLFRKFNRIRFRNNC
ncbi:hypothetical protein [Quatrionicoccus australiensis]|uniref:hypothetical protein n=1 Tax=Quatrionicoccus australiensis TaxID=138118 RepID=UPI001CF84A32|nr:hypothetical protein [Quatrionicoccus australiensis]UCV14335.1 hypothetical protein KI612_15520 [Quatrionicoccus australiensis]